MITRPIVRQAESSIKIEFCTFFRVIVAVRPYSLTRTRIDQQNQEKVHRIRSQIEILFLGHRRSRAAVSCIPTSPPS